jgi:hypothetical protein
VIFRHYSEERSGPRACGESDECVSSLLVHFQKEFFMQNQRRDFLKITAAGAAGLALARVDKAFAAWPTTGTLAVNPTISNMRVVSCYDTRMLKTALTSMTFAAENAAVDTAQVQANMDAMAMQLANQPTADAAWKAIFSSSKAWAATKVAIKVNTIEPKNMARLAVVQKFCNIFAGFGVLPANIIIYDGNTTYGAGISNYTPYFSTTDTTKTLAAVSSYNSLLGGTANAAIPGGNPATAACSADIANGTIDILVNIANNKGHSDFGGATLSMKNHFGTFAPNHGALPDYVFNINKSDAILGGTPIRQQLCFIDSIIANKASNTGTPEVAPCYLIMGVFGPAVDYLTVKQVREAVMGCTHDESLVTSYLTTFGYATTDPVWIVVPPANVGGSADGGTGTGGTGGAGGAGGGAGSSGAGGAGGSSGTSMAGGAGGRGGTSGAGGGRTGGTSGSAGAGGGGTSGSAGGGGTSGTGGAASSGSSGSAGGGGTSETGGAASGGTIASGGATSSASATSGGGGSGGMGGVATSVASASGGSTATGGTSARSGTTVRSAGGSVGSAGTTGTPGTTVNTGKSGGGCAVAGGDRRATRWGTMLAFGAVVAAKLRRLGSSGDRSS